MVTGTSERNKTNITTERTPQDVLSSVAQVLPSSACGAMPSGKRVTDSFRVSLAFYEEDKLRGAMEKLCDALNDFGRNQGLHKGKDEV